MADEAEQGAKVRVKYKGAAHYREISAADFKSVGVDDQLAIRVAGESALVRNHDYVTPRVVEVSEDAAAFLLDEEADDWEETDEEPVAPVKAKATARRLARAQAKEERELKKSASESATGEGGGSAGADSGSAGDANTGGGSSTGGRGGGRGARST